jgi:prevent-host-death family protein
MKLIPIVIDVSEAKTHLKELLRKVSAGQFIRITQRGKPIADLTPITSNLVKLPDTAAQKMLSLMKGVAVQAEIDIKTFINAGRD